MTHLCYLLALHAEERQSVRGTEQQSVGGRSDGSKANTCLELPLTRFVTPLNITMKHKKVHIFIICTYAI